jgi:ABC-2 type transport system permease protein
MAVHAPLEPITSITQPAAHSPGSATPFATARKVWRTAALAAAGPLGDGWYFALDYVLSFLRVAVLLAIWRAVLAGREGEGGMSTAAVLTYTLAAAVFGHQLGARTHLEQLLWSGDIAARLLRPMNLVAQVVAPMVGGWLPSLCLFSVPLLLAAPLLGVDPLPAGPAAAALFAVSLVLAIAVGIALDFNVAALMARYGWNTWDVERLRSALGALLSGAVVPLALLPWRLGEVLAWLPFAAMAWAPLRIYTGAGGPADPAEPLRLVAVQAGWAVALGLSAGRLWRANRQKVVIYGG